MRDVVDVHVDGIHRKKGMMYRNKINFAQPRLPTVLRPSVRPSPPVGTNSFHARGVSVEYE